ncbi:lantibiotic dehydratase [Actinomadura sp. 7K507]|uniref:lantibiotic dehydratase n=1 Tax=Actinomadura sp. 7K507 TaxID=2530365 RepID=UPI0010479874|nr:lantibiotic dehydratase [Actinomadura sp. 7K507]TDC97254.1 lantibiotic dehydratase [Actinomadura sp. 7K507]
MNSHRLYRPAPCGLLRAASSPAGSAPSAWPDLVGDPDPGGWRAWLQHVWQGPTAAAIRTASRSLARRVEAICAGEPVPVKDMRRAVVSVVRYVLRETSRPTPFGLFAGVADVEFTAAADVGWGGRHRVRVRADAEWLNEVITGLEQCAPLLERLPVTISTLRQPHGGWLTVPSGSGRVEIRRTPAVRAAEAATRTPMVFADMAACLAAQFPGVAAATINAMLTELVRQRFLVSALRAPGTAPDPLGHLLAQLQRVNAAEIAAVSETVAELRVVQAMLADGIRAPGDHGDRHGDQCRAREEDWDGRRVGLEPKMRLLATAGRSPVVTDLRLDCRVQLPEVVAEDMAEAASVLMRLTAQPGGHAAWREYHAAFLDRYGTGTLVALPELVDPGAGLGYPGGYPGAVLPEPEPGVEAENRPAGRDAGLLALVHRAIIDQAGEIVLNEETVAALGADIGQVRIPPHTELSARVHATSPAALDRGDYTLTVSPARAVGTMTGRFTSAGSPLAEVFAQVPTTVAGAVPAQVSAPMIYPHADNIARTDLFLPHIISLGEHRPPPASGEQAASKRPVLLDVEDLAVTADFDQLYLVSRRLDRVVEPHVFHALRLDKQPPTLARFLIAMARGRAARYTEFDWGTAAELPYLPRVRYGRCVLSPARWRLTIDDVPAHGADWAAFDTAFRRWRRRWRTPAAVELHEDDRALRLDLTEPAHAAILRDRLDRAGHVVLVEAPDPAGDRWLDGHAHQVVVPMLSTRPPVPCPLERHRPVPVTNTAGQLPGASDTRWLSAKLYAPPGLHSRILAEHLPVLLDDLSEPDLNQPDGQAGHSGPGGRAEDGLGTASAVWWLRYRDATDPDHLRIRVRTTGPRHYGTCAAAVGAWAARLREHGMVRRLILDTYDPEVGRYGHGPALEAAERVFVTDSTAVGAQLALPPGAAAPAALAAAGFTAITAAFTGSTAAGMQWLIEHPTAPPDTPPDRAVRAEAIALATGARDLPDANVLVPLWDARHAAITAYRDRLPPGFDVDEVLASLLHMHHIRVTGPHRPAEYQALHLARAAALTWRARKERQ